MTRIFSRRPGAPYLLSELERVKFVMKGGIVYKNLRPAAATSR